MIKKNFYFIILLIIGTIIFSCSQKKVYEATFEPTSRITNYTPMNDTTDVPIDTSIILDFDFLIIPASGNIILSAEGEDEIIISVIETSQITIRSRQAIITPSDVLSYYKTYTVTIPAGAFENEINEVPTADPTIFSFTTEDVPDPVIESFTPIDNATQVAIDTSIVLNFNIPITAVTPNDITITLTGEAPITIPIDDANQININGDIVTITPLDVLSFNKTYSVSIPAGAFQNASSVPTANPTTFSFTTEPIVEPIIESFTPIDNATQIAINTSIVLNFNTPITAITGNNITITSTGEAPITIPVDDTQVSISDRIVTITPSDVFSFNKTYSISIPAGAFQNANNAPTADPTAFSFTTEPIVEPIIESFTPIDNATQIAVTTPIVLNFNTPITPVTGNITITANGEAPITIPVDDAQVSISDRIVTITPSSALSFNQTYSISIPAGAFKNAASVPTATATNFSFTTVVVNPIIVTVNPTDNATQVAVTTPIVLNFNTPITAVTPNDITITPTGETPITIPIDDANQININGNIVTITPSDVFSFNQTYSISIPAGAFQNANNAPTANPTVFSFTTENIPDPVIENFTPTDNATQIAINTPIVLNFNTPITAVNGNNIIITPTGETPITIPIDDANQININGDIVTITPLDVLSFNQTYSVSIPAGAFQNANNAPTANPTAFSFSTPTGVFIHSLILENTNANPANAINLAELEVYTNHSRQGINFATNTNNTITSGMVGNFEGPNVADRLIDGNRANVAPTDIYHSFGTFATENWVKLSFDPPIFLDTNNNDTSLLEVVVYNRENRNNFQDRATNLTVHLYDDSDTQIATFGIGLSLAEAQNDILSFPFDLLFDTNTIPMIVSHIPTDSATDVLISTPITLDFNIRVSPMASKNIILTPQGDSPITIAATDPQVRIIGNTVTINPTSALIINKQYIANVEAGAFKSLHDIPSTMTTSFTFTTESPVPPMVNSHTPIDSATTVFVNNATFILTFNTPITAINNYNMTLTPTASDGTTITIALDNTTQVNIVDRIVTIKPTVNLDLGEYTFNIPPGAFKNIENMPTTIGTTFTFTTILPFADFNLNPDNNSPHGITFANNKFWVVDSLDNKVYAYDTGGTYSPSDDFNLVSQNGAPRGITFANNKFWITDGSDNQVYSYDDSIGAHDFYLDKENQNSQGTTFWNNMFWVVDNSDNQVYAYASGGTYSPSDDFNLVPENNTGYGIIFWNNMFWVVDELDDKVYAYKSSGSPNSINDFNLDSENIAGRGITFVDNMFWVVDAFEDKVYVYDVNGNRP